MGKRMISPQEYQALQDSTKKHAPAPGDRLSPTGELKHQDKAYLKSLKNKSVDSVLNKTVNKSGEVTRYGTPESDYIKGVLNTRKPAVSPQAYKPK